MRTKLIINLQLFAEGAGDRTEKATPKKRKEAREKGQVLQSREITSALVLLLVFVTLRLYGTRMFLGLTELMEKVFVEYPSIEGLFSPNSIKILFFEVVIAMIKIIAPILLVAMVAGIMSSYAQIGFLFTTQAMSFKLERINPVSGFKRMFSMRSVVELLKSIFKITVVGYAAYSYIRGEIKFILGTMDMSIEGIASYIGTSSINLAIRLCAVLIVLGIADYGYQWWEYERNLRMSKEELKEEYKQVEGNPQIKSKIKQKQKQLSMSRMIKEVPKADVVITNPTHYAVAVKYDVDISDAPIVLAKGQGYIALRIKDIAGENRVEVVENRDLARLLFETVDVGEVIPPELYQAVAEVLAYVYSLKKD